MSSYNTQNITKPLIQKYLLTYVKKIEKIRFNYVQWNTFKVNEPVKRKCLVTPGQIFT